MMRIVPARTTILTNVVLADVNAFAPNGHGHIDSIIDEERYIVAFRDLVQLFGFTNQLSCIARFLTVLDDGNTWLR